MFPSLHQSDLAIFEDEDYCLKSIFKAIIYYS